MNFELVFWLSTLLENIVSIVNGFWLIFCSLSIWSMATKSDSFADVDDDDIWFCCLENAGLKKLRGDDFLERTDSADNDLAKGIIYI